jgi:5-formyltetrahydrofolate cyclo-ligase
VIEKGEEGLDKKEWRKKMKKTLSSLSKQEYEQYSYCISKSLFSTKEWQEASVVGVTVSIAPEVDTWQVIREAWNQKKIVAVPKCLPDEKRLQFHTLTSFLELETVFYGLFEPIPEQTAKMDPPDIDLLLVPGLAFMENGYRLGFGGGYYDRFLKLYRKKTASLAFSCQIVSQLPVESHDIPVQKIITEERIIECDSI